MKQLKENLYEGMYILRPTLSDDAREKALSRVVSLIETLGGKHHKTIDFERRKLAHSIKEARDGYYYLLYFTLPTSALGEVMHENHLNEDLLRFMHVAIEKIPEGNKFEFKQVTKEIKKEER
ncbi:MAG: 30S ribosomal protein S6 [Chlamydiae bacterium RIFCSPHIGHO2_12_FULL_49_11]|nr:MAG: 30S ribosomal protein S6 [Chlamydiae bacterium RIFCSPHIGHO2_12_FULL_49_11]